MHKSMFVVMLAVFTPLLAQQLPGDDDPGFSFSQAATFHNDLTVEQQEFFDQLHGYAQGMYLKLSCEGRNRAMCLGICPDEAVERVWAEGIYYQGCCK
jgi:Fe-S-cluster-containing hydrogenase component 2